MPQAPPSRPAPDAFLRKVELEAQKARPKLKIFLGFAPGVGKTFAMLEEAHRLKNAGVAVLVGCIETHGREATARLTEDLDILPRRQIDYRGTRLDEFDLEAALKRRPRILLLDELAHTNAPGSAHQKRWQDVFDLLDAGIDVHTTLNIQHLESLNDIVKQVTGIDVRETVPDALLERADAIELVDLPPEALLERLAEGKVYSAAQAAQAKEHFFRRGNLLALRELALRATADRVDADVSAYRKEHSIEPTWPSTDRLLVCVSASPASAKLIRASRRMAAALDAPWIAAVVETPDRPLSASDRLRVEGHMQLAQSLGATTCFLSGASIAETLVAYARRENVTKIVVGKPTHASWRDRFAGSLLDGLVRASGDIEVHVISGVAGTRTIDEPKAPRPDLNRAHIAYGLLAVILVTMGAFAARNVIGLPDVAMLYVLVITAIAARFGRAPSVIAAAASVAAYDFFFVPPFYTFAVSDGRHWLTFLTMFVVAQLTSSLTLQLRAQERAASAREQRTSTLYALSRELTTAPDARTIAAAAVAHASRLAGTQVVVVSVKEDKSLDLLASSEKDAPAPSQWGVIQWTAEHRRPAGPTTDTLPGAACTALPLHAGGRLVGVFAICWMKEPQLDREQWHFWETLTQQVAQALTRAEMAESAKRASLRAEAESMRNSLLSAVSHDLRTPIAIIAGSATTLASSAHTVPPLEQAQLLDTIADEAQRLDRLVSNLLEMTRLETGAAATKREFIFVEELVGAAIARLSHQLSGRAVKTAIPQELPMLEVDPVWMEQAFINILDNISKYTPEGTSVDISARVEGSRFLIEVLDRGPGIPEELLPHLFERFVRGDHLSTRGTGLGLAITAGIIHAHLGSIRAYNRDGGGAAFEIVLPLTRQPSPAPVDA